MGRKIEDLKVVLHEEAIKVLIFSSNPKNVFISVFVNIVASVLI